MKTLTGFARPGRATLISDNRARYQSVLPGADFTLAQGIVPRLPELDAEAQNTLHAHLDFNATLGHPLFATGDAQDGWGRTFNVVRKAASFASGSLNLTGLDGTIVPAGAEFIRNDGVIFTVDVGGVIAASALAVNVTAAERGKVANTDAAATLSVVSPIAGLTSTATISAGGITGGADAEADGKPGVSEHYRARILARISAPPHGGNRADYENWIKAVPGVTRVWVSPLEMGLGTVAVRFMMDDTYDDGIPLGDGAPEYTGDLKTVADHLEAHVDPITGLTAGRPIGAEVFVVAPVADELDVTITGLSPDTPEIRAEISAEIADMVRRRAVPGGSIYLNWIAEAVSIATGEDSHEITEPAVTKAHATGVIAVPGSVTFV